MALRSPATANRAVESVRWGKPPPELASMAAKTSELSATGGGASRHPKLVACAAGWGKPPPEPAAQSAERSAATIQSISLTQPKRFPNPTSFVLALIRVSSVWVSASIVSLTGVIIHVVCPPAMDTARIAARIAAVAADGVLGVAADVGPASQPHLCSPA